MDSEIKQYYSWNGAPVEIEWFDGPCDVTTITSPAIHPNGTIPEGERHALVELIAGTHQGWWASESAVEEHAELIGPAGEQANVGIE